jgi:transcriptional regulator with GAF, ATPase, and Fis domain
MPETMESNLLIPVLGEIAETASETLELQEVFDRVAASVRRLIPFDNMGVVRFLDGERTVVHATTVSCDQHAPVCSEPTPLTNWSPRMRPQPEPIPRIDDTHLELDPAFPNDADLIKHGVRSALWESFRTGGEFSGGVWLSSYTPCAFTAEHQEILRPIAAILGSAVEHWRIWDAERRRRERLDRLEAIVAPLAEALDVREVFGRISEQLRAVLPHESVGLTDVDSETGAVRILAVSGAVEVPLPSRPFHLTREEADRRLLDYEIIRDLQIELEPTTERNRLLLATGMRSWLRVPVRLWEEVRGSLLFLHGKPGRYTEEDVEVARRVADRIALAMSHHRLADEARIAAEARERARRLEATVEALTRELESRTRGRIVGVSRSWKQVLAHVGRVAAADTTVLITGESGTGKEVVAQLIHEGSPRKDRPFVAINCAALPEQLLESELFGHERGAFTGAFASKIGRIEQAEGGTLFLDEIGEMSPLLQAKLLRVLQEREFQRLGGTRTQMADVRVLAATNRDLTAAIGRGQFREDLYYRLNVFEIRIPPLRERPEDILVLAKMFLDDLGRSMGRPAAGLSRDARECLLAYPWPGNVRELRNAIERAILLCDGGLITRDHLPAPLPRPAVDPAALPSGPVNLASVDRAYVEKALRQANGNKSKAARMLGLSRSQLYSRLEKYGLL